jgi:type II secretory pathway pseudopilin PulG
MRHGSLRSAKLQTANYRSQIPQRGYMMITLMLALALITIALLAVLPSVKQQILRDREEEMQHRGTAYMRAIQHFYKKFNRYPTRVEELENTNNLRFLRRRYTDPMNRDRATGKEKDFKFLRQQDITLNSGPVLGQQTQAQGGPGAQSGFGGQSGFGSQGGLGGAQSGFGGQGGLGSFGGPTGAAQQTGPGSQPSASGGSGSSSSGGSSSAGTSSADSSNEDGSSSASGQASSNSNQASGSSSGLNGPTFGGGPILGVASMSKEKTIRVFFEKNHYNDWLFVYMPQADRGGLLTGPINPGMQTGNMGGLTPGQMAGGVPGQGGLGQTGLGQGLGQGLTPNSGQNQGFPTQQTQPPPAQTPPQ